MSKGASQATGLSQQAAEPVVSALTGFDPSRMIVLCDDVQSRLATYIAHPKMTDGTQGGDWPVCREHMQWAMVAGWFPIDEIGADQ